MNLIHATTRRWTVDEYLRLCEQGILPAGERVELIEGEIVSMAAMGSRHREAIINSNETLVLAFRGSHRVACQVDVRMGQYSCPEPDFSVIKRHLPTETAFQEADLVIEVSDTSLAYDRCEKASLYAKATIPEYWILNTRTREVEVHRQPQLDGSAIFGSSYGLVFTLSEEKVLIPLCRPDLSIKISDLF